MRSITVPEVRARKGGVRLVMVTAYDAPGARMADDAGVDLILVGDSVGNNVLGYDDTLQVTVEDMEHHVAAVARARPAALVVADLPWLSYHTGVDQAVANAGRLIRAGAKAVKLEGGAKRLPVVNALIGAEIPVMGHLGLTPQSILAMGGFRVQGQAAGAIAELRQDAAALDGAGVFSLVLEGIPDLVAEMLTRSVSVPTIGIGAGPGCDGQVLVFHDILGLGSRRPPRFAREYASLGSDGTAAIRRWAVDVQDGSFPNASESYHLPEQLTEDPARLAGAASSGEARRETS